jgi:hypothetical protein
MIKKPVPIGLKIPNPLLPFCWLTEEQWTNIMFSIVGISPYESQDPDDTTEYPIPDGKEILQFIRSNQKCPLSPECVATTYGMAQESETKSPDDRYHLWRSDASKHAGRNCNTQNKMLELAINIMEKIKNTFDHNGFLAVDHDIPVLYLVEAREAIDHGIEELRKQRNLKYCNKQCEDCHKMFDCPDSSVGEQL